MSGAYSVERDFLDVALMRKGIVMRCFWPHGGAKGHKRPRATHVFRAGGCAMSSGCEWHMHALLRDSLRRRRA